MFSSSRSRELLLLISNDKLFIFVCFSGAYAQAANTAIVLVGGVSPSQVFWQVSGTLTVGSGAVGATFRGIALGATQITLTTGSSITGRIFSQTGVAIQKADISQPQDAGCSSNTVTVTEGEVDSIQAMVNADNEHAPPFQSTP